MSAVRTRLAMYPVVCPHCREVINRGELILGITKGSTETSACFDCAWAVWEARQRGEETE